MATKNQATPVQLSALYEELIALNKIRGKGKPKENEKNEKRAAQLNIEIRDIEHILATKKVDKK